MSKTDFEYVAPPNENNSTTITDIFLDRINNQVPTGEDIDGSSPLLYGVDSGAANAYVLNMTFGPDSVVFPQSLQTGLKLLFKATNANTGASTLNVNSIGAKDIKHIDGTTLQSGDIIANEIIEVFYDGASFRLFEHRRRKVARDIGRELYITNNSTNPNYQLDIDAVERILHDVIGNPLRVVNANLTVDVSTTGANGRDPAENGGAEKASDWYNIWLISNGANVAAYLTLADSGPSLPSGYTHYSWLGTIYNDASSNFVNIYQENNYVDYNVNRNVKSSAFTTGSWTSVNVTTFFPPQAKRIRFAFGGEDGHYLGLSPRSDGHGGSYFQGGETVQATHNFGGVFSASYNYWSTHEIRYEDTIYYCVGNSDALLTALGWKY